MERCKTSQGKVRTDLNPKADFVEFIVNNRAMRLERYLEKYMDPNKGAEKQIDENSVKSRKYILGL